MLWERCFGRATDGIRQERYISVNSRSVVSYGPYSQREKKGPLIASYDRWRKALQFGALHQTKLSLVDEVQHGRFICVVFI